MTQPTNQAIRQSAAASEAVLRRRKTRKPSSVKHYGFIPRVLLLNNTVLFFLWFSCLVRLLILLPLVGRRFLPGGLAEFYQALLTASFASQFLVSALGIIRVPRNKTHLKLFKLAHGLLITWGVVFHYPKVARHSAYGVLVFCCSLQEAFDYFSFLFRASLTRSLRKKAFVLLFPAQRIAEIALIMVSFKFNKRYYEQSNDKVEYFYGVFLKFVLVLYVPASYIIYRYLWRTRND